MSDRGRFEYDEFIAHPPESVWRALTDPELHARWWAAGDVRPVVGHRFTLDMGPWGQQRCEVVAADPPRVFGYTFGEGTLDTTITWRLVAEGRGTRLHLIQDGFDLDSPMGRQARDGMGEGWPHLVTRIGATLDGASTRS
jgi:uncharacterized protein YndB with AHSA1/START domain